MKIALRLAIVFELAIKRQDLREAPFGVAPSAPLLKILRRPAKRDMAVHSGRATGNLAARVSDLAIGCRLGDQAPIVRPDGDPSVQEIVGTLLDGRVIRTGFYQQHGAVLIFAQASSQYGAGRPRTNDDVVVFHRSASSEALEAALAGISFWISIQTRTTRILFANAKYSRPVLRPKGLTCTGTLTATYSVDPDGTGMFKDRPRGSKPCWYSEPGQPPAVKTTICMRSS